MTVASRVSRRPWVAAAVTLLVVVASGLIWKLSMRHTPNEVHRPTTIRDVVPAPESLVPAAGVIFAITPTTEIRTSPGSAEATQIGEYLADLIRPGTEFPLPVGPGSGEPPSGGIALVLIGGTDDERFGDEGYELEVTASDVSIRANAPAGLFRGVQTLRQILPASIEVATPGGEGGPWAIPGGRIVDRPRYAYRGVMLDVARHFFGVAEVKRVIDLVALYKVNYLHLHLTDDQGWRIAIDSWPRLATYGGGTEVGTEDAGGYYTRDDYSEIVSYAARHYITVVPEVDLPGHTNAALASYAELNCDGKAPPRYTGTNVGFSSLCVDKDVTYRFLDEVFGELAALTPGPYLHIGGDEAHTLDRDGYSSIVTRAQEIVSGHGKTVMGWHEIAASKLLPGTVAQYWGTTPTAPLVVEAAAQGSRIVMSPANRTYLDMKYDSSTRLGLTWAGTIDVSEAYDWEPTTYLDGLDPSAVLGVESPLWTETLLSLDDIEHMMMPRLPAIAEIGWSPVATHDWDGFRNRLGAQAPRWRVLGVDFYRSAEIPWIADPDPSAIGG